MFFICSVNIKLNSNVPNIHDGIHCVLNISIERGLTDRLYLMGLNKINMYSLIHFLCIPEKFDWYKEIVKIFFNLQIVVHVFWLAFDDVCRLACRLKNP